MVTVRLGQVDEAVEIPVNLELLKAVSPYFGGAFEGGFKEATDRKIESTDVTEQTFCIFLHGRTHSSTHPDLKRQFLIS